MGNHRQTANMLALFGIVIALFAVFTLGTGVRTADISDLDSLKGFDFASAVARISPDCYSFYPEKLYTPRDFAEKSIGPAQAVDDGTAQFGTYFIEFNLPEGVMYGLSGYSRTYSQILWIDGEERARAGTPGDRADAVEPATLHFTEYFEAKPGGTTVVIQWANFVHDASGLPSPLYLGEAGLVADMDTGTKIRVSLAVGCMLTSVVFFFGIFLFFLERKHFLWFSLACLFMAVRTMIVDHKIIMELIPGMSWYISSKIEYVATVGLMIFFFLYLNIMFKWKMKRWINVLGLAVSCGYIVMVIVLPPIVYTRFLTFVQHFVLFYALAAIFYFVRSMVRYPENRRLEHFLILAGAAVYISLAGVDMMRHNLGGLADLNLIQAGMVAFLLANTLAQALNFAEMEVKLNESERRELEMGETNRVLERLNQLKTDFLANITHEMKTPLSIMSGYAQLTQWQLDSNSTGADTADNLRAIAGEAQRLALLVNRLLSVSAGGEERVSKAPVCVREILERAYAISEPLLEKNRNRLETSVEGGGMRIRANGDMMLQVILNLVSNANRHTIEGVISITVARRGGMAEFCVRDDGEGVPEEFLPHAFDRGRSGDGGTGLGLAICREAVEDHGGEIKIESQRGRGTAVTFTVPVEEQEEINETYDTFG